MSGKHESSSLEDALEGLTHGLGVERSSLAKDLDSALYHIWHISQGDGLTSVRGQVVWQLNRLIDDALDEENQEIARFRFNLIQHKEVKLLDLGRRLIKHQEKYGGPS